MGLVERMRVPSPAASTTDVRGADVTPPCYHPERAAPRAGGQLGGEESNPHSRDQNPLSCRWTTPDRRSRYRRPLPARLAATGALATLRPVMGSLIKKRRKRMRKKKHKKMLKRTRFQRRAKK